MEDRKKPVPPTDDIDIMRYVSLFVSNWIWIAVAMFLALSLAYTFNRYSARVYNVKSTLLIKEEQSTTGFANMDKILPGGDIFGSRQNLENEITILESYSLNYRVMEEMEEFNIAYVPVNRQGIQGQRMYHTSPFVIKKLNDDQPSEVSVEIYFTSPETFTLDVDEDELKTWSTENGVRSEKEALNAKREFRLGEPITTSGFNFVVEQRDSSRSVFGDDNRYLTWFDSPADLANDYRESLTVAPAKEDASVVTLSYDGYAPEQGADYLNRLMNLYIRQGLELKGRAADNTITFIDGQLGLISDSLNLAENDMENFRLNNRFVDLTLEGTLVLERLEKFESEKNVLGLQKQYYEYLLDYLNSREESGSIISPSVMGVTDPVLVNLVGEFAMLQQQKKQVAFTLKDNVPQLNLIDQQIEASRAALHENVSSAISQLKLTERTINSRISQVEKELDRLPGTERSLIGIQRKFDLNNSVYTFLLERRAEAGIAKASQISDNRIIDMAMSHNSDLIRPKTMKNYLVAVLLGLLIPMMLIVIIDLLNNKIIGRHDIEALTKAPIIGFISHSEYHVEDPVAEKPGSTLAESFRAVRTSLAFYTGQTKCPVIVVSSPVSGEGKTFVSVNLATIISMMNKKVLIIGLDLRKPRVHAILRAGNGNGMSQYLSNNATFEEVIVPTSVENLFFAPSGPVPPNPAELIGSPKMAEFIARARGEFDTVIIDTPPVGIVTDALLLGQLTNITLFVVRQRYTTRNSVSLLDEIYRKGEMSNIALVVNDISSTGYYGYGLRYGYTLGYGHRYYDPGNYYNKGRDKNMGYYTND
ncbi:MAG TPA: polysaccharide biosynthesis tyrosine autokinase [Bacteroidales bacterium]|nr:polysaccharide biosynthesis tyrosine autokinase [Bacteroidales bacterium]